MHATLDELVALHADYAAAVDGGDWAGWIALFTADAVYRIVPRENHERGLPLATLALRGHGMLKDRAYAVGHTLFHDPYYQRHVVGLPRVRAREADALALETHYAVFRTKLNGETTVFNVGRYLDRVVRERGALRLAERLVVYDSEMIPNSIIHPL
jgi:salicylate 5-hydroxylase small subunit